MDSLLFLTVPERRQRWKTGALANEKAGVMMPDLCLGR